MYWSICRKKNSKLSDYSDEELHDGYMRHRHDVETYAADRNIKVKLFDLGSESLGPEISEYLGLEHRSFLDIDGTRTSSK